MGKKLYCCCYNATHAGYFHLFAESSEGHFGHNVGSPTQDTAQEWESTSTTQIVAVAVPKVAGKYCSTFQSTSTNATVTNYGILTFKGTYSYYYQNKAFGSSSSSGASVTVIDEHGTHDGTPTGTNRFYNSQAVGVFHTGTDDGYTFTGWKVTFNRSSSASYVKFLSTFSSGEATTSGTVTTVSAAYAERYAVVLQMGTGTSSSYALTIEALYEQGAVQHTLTYNSNGGSPTPSPVSAETGTAFTLASAPTKSGYNFDGWLITGESTARGAGTTYTMPAQDVTATAQWSSSSRTYYLYYSLNGGSPNYSSQSCQTGGYITLNGNPTKSKYDFGGWTITRGTSSGEVVETEKYAGYNFYPTGTTTSFYANAQWVAQQPHTLSYKTGYSGGTPPASQTDIYSGTSVTLASALSRTGYNFTGWLLSHTSSVVSAGGTFTMPAQDVVATGQWSAKTVTITYYHGYDSGTYGTQSGKAGNTVTLKAAQTRSGYTFSGWLVRDQSGDDSSTRTYSAGASYQLRSDATATALWTPSQITTYTVSYNKNAEDVTGDEIPVVSVTSGNQTSVRAPDLWKRNGFQFICWSTSSAGTGAEYQPGDMLAPTGNTTLYARWVSDTRSGYASSYHKTVYNTSYPQNDYETCTTGATMWLLTNVRNATVAVSYETRTQGTGLYYNNGTYYQYRESTYTTSGTTYGYSSPLSYGSKRILTTTISSGASGVITYPGGTEVSFYSYAYSGYDYTSHKSGMGFEYNRANSFDDEWQWTAPDIVDYEFQGWYALDQSYSTQHSVSDNEFHLLVSKEKTIKWGDFKGKLNYIRHTARSDSTGSYAYGYSNCLYLKYLGKKVMVLFDAGDGEVSPFFKEVRYDGTYGDLPTPTPPTGYSFSGWYTASTGGSSVSSSTSVTNPEDHTLYARYTSTGSLSVTVTFNGMGGTPSYSTRSYTAGSTYTTLPTGSYSGKSLAGWYTGAFDGTKVETSSTVPSYNHTLYARWTTTMYTITLNANGGTVSKSSIQVVAGSPLTWIPTPTHATDTFVGWFTSAVGGNEVLTTTVPTGNMTIHAHWETGGGGGGGGGGGSSESSSVQRGYVRYYGMALHYNGGTLSSSYRKRYDTKTGKDLPTSTEITKSGAAFLGWYRDAALTDGPVSSIPAGTTGKVEFYAKWFE